MPAQSLVVIAGYDNLAHTFEISAAGELSLLCKSDIGTNPSYMALRGERAFCVNETANGRVSALSFSSKTGEFAVQNAVSAQGDDPCHISISSSGNWVLVSNYSSRGLTLLPVDGTGKLGEAAAVLEPGRNCHQAVVVGQFVYVPFLGADAVYVYTLDEAKGVLSPHASSPVVRLAKGAGPRHIALDAARHVAYIINELDMTLSAVTYDAGTGTLGAEPFVTVGTLPPHQSKSGCSTAHVVVSSDGRFVYASNRHGVDSTVAVFGVETGPGGNATGLRACSWTAPGEVHTPRDFALSPDETLLVCANQGTNSATVFARDAGSGELTKVADAPTGVKPCFVAFVGRE